MVDVLRACAAALKDSPVVWKTWDAKEEALTVWEYIIRYVCMI